MTHYDPDIVGQAINDTIDAALSPIKTTVTELRARLDEMKERLRDADSLRERVAAVESRPPIPGPKGEDGKDGNDGSPGVDGLGFDDLAVEYDGERTIILSFLRGIQTKRFPIELPILKYCGVWTEGQSYKLNDVVTLSGSAWICTAHETVVRPGDNSSGWQLMVKRGADGRR